MNRLIIGRLCFDRRRPDVIGRLTSVGRKCCKLATGDVNRLVYKRDLRQGRPRQASRWTAERMRYSGSHR